MHWKWIHKTNYVQSARPRAGRWKRLITRGAHHNQPKKLPNKEGTDRKGVVETLPHLPMRRDFRRHKMLEGARGAVVLSKKKTL